MFSHFSHFISVISFQSFFQSFQVSQSLIMHVARIKNKINNMSYIYGIYIYIYIYIRIYIYMPINFIKYMSVPDCLQWITDRSLTHPQAFFAFFTSQWKRGGRPRSVEEGAYERHKSASSRQLIVSVTRASLKLGRMTLSIFHILYRLTTDCGIHADALLHLQLWEWSACQIRMWNVHGLGPIAFRRWSSRWRRRSSR